MPTNSAGFTTPAASVDNVNHTDIQALADRLDAILGAKTAAQITALTGTDNFLGRLVRQSDGSGSTNRRFAGLYTYSGTTWTLAAPDGVGAGSSAFSPTLSAVTTAPNMGTSPTQTCDWWQLGGWIFANYRFVWGTGAPTPGSGALLVPLPMPVLREAQPGGPTVAFPLGFGTIRDSSLSNTAMVEVEATNDTTASMWYTGAATQVTGAAPLTLGATGDSIELELRYPWRDA